MTFNNAPWAVDGARIPAALARAASYAETGSAEGVISSGDLKVSTLDVPGVGVQIAPGGALVLNRYQTSPTETYTILNSGVELVDGADMPPADPAARSHLVCVTIGDPEFSQVGHPWMTGDPLPAGTEETFQYVRAFVIPNVPGNTTSFKSLGLTYPALALARIDVPANTSTITSDMIVDLRHLARPRSKEIILNGSGFAEAHFDGFDADTYRDFGGVWNVEIPEWATSAKITGWVEGLALYSGDAAYGNARVAFQIGNATPPTVFDWDGPPAGASFDRSNYGIQAGGNVAIPEAHRGTTKVLQFQFLVHGPQPLAPTNDLMIDGNTTSMVRIRFDEDTV